MQEIFPELRGENEINKSNDTWNGSVKPFTNYLYIANKKFDFQLCRLSRINEEVSKNI